MSFRKTLLALLVFPLLAFTGHSQQVSFEELGQAFLEARCPGGAGAAGGTPGEECELENIVASSYATVRLGAFELALPVEFLGDRKRGREVQTLARALVDLQGRWVDWFCAGESEKAAILANLDALGAWIDGWEKSKLSALDKGPGGSLYDLLEADDEVKATSEQVRAAILDRGLMGIAPQHTDAIRILGCPTRRDFMELVGYAGLLRQDKKKELWNAGVDQWTQFWIDRSLVIALEYAPWSSDPKFKTGQSMEKYDKDGLRQQVVLQSARALLFTSFNRTDLALLEKGIALNLTLEVCGRANTIDGEGAISSTGGITAPYSRFVPGGNPNGGSLPPAPAAALDAMLENHWRDGAGKDHFDEALRKGQKEGAKRAAKDKNRPLYKDKSAHFQLVSESGQKHAVTAPFLGRIVKQKQYPPADYLNDYREFFRSYQSSFLHWLSSRGVPGSEQESHDKYRQLVLRMGHVGPGGVSTLVEIDDAVQQVYGLPLSAFDSSTDSLEWRYLAWLQGGGK